MILNKTHLYTCEIPFDWLDPGAVVYHANYLVLLDRARTAGLSTTGYSFSDFWKDGYALVVRKVTLDYLKPIRMGQYVTVLSQLKEYSSTSLYVTQTVISKENMREEWKGKSFIDGIPNLDPKEILHQMEVHLVSVQLESLRPVRIPQRLMEALELPIKSKS
jgi:YbgC/YbaW family acyl-CoA thioester hydrolase